MTHREFRWQQIAVILAMGFITTTSWVSAQDSDLDLSPTALLELLPMKGPAPTGPEVAPAPAQPLGTLSPPVLQKQPTTAAPHQNQLEQQPASPPAMAVKPTPYACSYTRALNLTHNQKYRLKRARATFVADNKAAYDSLRIKRNLIKRLGKNPPNAREKQQRDQLKQEIQRELQVIRAKKDAQIEHLLTPEQTVQWHAMRQQCQPQEPGPLSRFIHRFWPEKE